jgi:hypothetical protein
VILALSITHELILTGKVSEHPEYTKCEINTSTINAGPAASVSGGSALVQKNAH